jgi:hypothetical protein
MDLGKLNDELFQKIEKFGGKKFIDSSYLNGNTKEDRKECFNNYKVMKSLAKNGFSFLSAMSNNKQLFEKVSNDFIQSSLKLLNSYSGDYHTQTGGVQLISSLPNNEKIASFSIDQGLIDTLFREKMSNPLWKKIGIFDTRLLHAMVQTGKQTSNKIDQSRCSQGDRGGEPLPG